MIVKKGELQKHFSLLNTGDTFQLDSSKISTDTRKINKGDIFYAIQGENFDGNNFLETAVNSGAAAIICAEGSKIPLNSSVPLLQYKNDKQGLFDLSQLILASSNALRVAITGSNGKTTTKEILAHLLSSKFNTLKTLGNFNNNIGLPLTLFKLEEGHQVAVLEMGMNALGEIDYLAKLARPKFSLITNVARAHLQFLKTLENVATAKCEIIDHTTDATIINADCELLLKEAQKHSKKILKASAAGQVADIFVEKILEENFTSTVFALKDNYNKESCTVELPLAGRHNVSNYILAHLTARLAGLSLNDILEATKSIKPFEKRFDITNILGRMIINDCYNANPDSMIAGLNTFSKFRAKRKIALLGDMKELGEHEAKLHYEIGTVLDTLNIDHVITYGKMSLEIVRNLQDNESNISTISYLDYSELLSYLKETLVVGDALYVKASNAMKLSNLVKDLNLVLDLKKQ